MAKCEVLIVGAGPTGLTAAIELARSGIPFRLIDKSDHAAQHSQALVVQARTLEQLERYGIAETAVERGRRLRQASFNSNGKQIASLELDLIPGRYPFVLFLPQSETERLLTEELGRLGGKIERRTELTSLRQDGGAIEAGLILAEGTRETIAPRWLIGCDGAHSAVRSALNVAFTGEAVSLRFFLGDLKLEGADLPGDKLQIHVHGGDVVVIGRLTETTYRVIAARHPSEDEPSAAEKQELTLADFQERFDAMKIPLTVASSDWMTPFSVNDRQAERMCIGNVFLAGDASHIHSPVGGQGMNTGIQDIANLTWKIAAVRRGAEDELLDSYEEERKPVGKALLDNTSRALKAATVSSPFLEYVRNTVMSFVPRIPWVRQEISGFVSETAIEYRDSSIVENHDDHGSLRAGDRVPNPELRLARGEIRRLLDGLKSGRHLAIAWNVKTPEFARAAVTGAEFWAIGETDLQPEGNAELKALFGAGEEVLVIRPDGYLGYRGNVQGHQALEQYARRVAIA